MNDATSTIANCSLILNGKINKTNYTIIEQGFPFKYNNFTVYDVPDGVYNWSVNCTDTASAHNMKLFYKKS